MPVYTAPSLIRRTIRLIQIYNDPRSNNLNYAVWDLSDISKQLVTKAEIQTLALIDGAFSSRLGNLKLAFVAIDEPSRLFCSNYVIQAIQYDVNWEFQIFKTLEEAIDWGESDNK